MYVAILLPLIGPGGQSTACEMEQFYCKNSRGEQGKSLPSFAEGRLTLGLTSPSSSGNSFLKLGLTSPGFSGNFFLWKATGSQIRPVMVMRSECGWSLGEVHVA